MSAPSSAILLAEIFLQFMECNSIYNILLNHKIILFRYVDDILLKYSAKHMAINLTLHEFNYIHPKLQFVMEQEQNNRINFLDVTIQRTGNNIL